MPVSYFAGPYTDRASTFNHLYSTACSYDRLRRLTPSFNLSVASRCLRHRTKNCDTCEWVKMSTVPTDALKVLAMRYKVAHGLLPGCSTSDRGGTASGRVLLPRVPPAYP
jgi:hypothetical protein